MTPAWILRRTVLELRRQGGPLLALGSAFMLAALLLGGYRLARPAMPALRGGAVPAVPAQVIAYLREDLDQRAIQSLRDVLAQLPGVERVKLVAPEEALARLRQQLGERGRVLDGAEDGLLPASLEVWLRRGPADGVVTAAGSREQDPGALARQLAWRLQRVDGIVEVDAVQPRGDERVTAWAGAFARQNTVLLAATLLGAAVVVLFGAVAGRGRRRAEMQVLLALGFTRSALVLPTVLLGFFVALVGTASGLALAHVGWQVAVAAWPAPLAPLSFGDWVVVLAGGAGLGALTGLSAGHLPDLVDAS
ncbi:MAG TPA: permease-like cell division protein FtsX [Polyangia bacterium]|nr:permease-like cell division protein FtsX [Polyangia bacterium]